MGNRLLIDWLTRQVATLGRSVGTVYPSDLNSWAPKLKESSRQGRLGVIRPDKPGVFPCGIALSHDGHWLFCGTSDGRVQAWLLDDGTQIWDTHHHTNIIRDLKLSPNGRYLASGSSDTSICILDAETGDLRLKISGHEGKVLSLAFSPDGLILASGSEDHKIGLWNTETGNSLGFFYAHSESVNCVIFSPDGRHLVSGSNDRKIKWWDPQFPAESPEFAIVESSVLSLVYSPDGLTLASGQANNSILFFDNEAFSNPRVFTHSSRAASHLAFSPDGYYLAGTGNTWTGEATYLWDIQTGRVIRKFIEGHKNLVWSPTGSFLAISQWGNAVAIFETNNLSKSPQLIEPQHISTSSPLQQHVPLPFDWQKLPEIWATLHQLGIDIPLSLLNDVRNMLAGKKTESLAPLFYHHSVQELQNLHWPENARIGLIALLLHKWPGASEWCPPANTTRGLSNAIIRVINNGSPCLPDAPASPIAWLTQRLQTVDDRLLTILTALGPRAVATDPGLPLRLHLILGSIPNLTQAQRQLLGQHITSNSIGASQGNGIGQDHSGITRHGLITTLLPNQWVFPRHLLYLQHINGNLLYRTRTGRESPQLRSMVILLDTSPACWGSVESITRLAAHALAETLASQRRPAVLLTSADQQVCYLNSPAERLQILTHRSHHFVDIPAVMRKAQALRTEFADGPLEPAIILLTHSYWGGDLLQATRQSGLRALFVQYPGKNISPPFARFCERWETVQHDQSDTVIGALGRLTG